MPELSDLGLRVSKNFDYLLGRELAGDTDGNFNILFEKWEKLLRQYEAELTAAGRTQ